MFLKKQFAMLNSFDMLDFIEKLIYEQRFEGSESLSQTRIWGKTF